MLCLGLLSLNVSEERFYRSTALFLVFSSSVNPAAGLFSSLLLGFPVVFLSYKTQFLPWLPFLLQIVSDGHSRPYILFPKVVMVSCC